jgi:hypothetical protein
MELRLPEQAERGQSYYFALDPRGETGPVMSDPPFQVLVQRTLRPAAPEQAEGQPRAAVAPHPRRKCA